MYIVSNNPKDHFVVSQAQNNTMGSKVHAIFIKKKYWGIPIFYLKCTSTIMLDYCD